MLPSNITQSITSSKIALANTTKPVTNAINSVPNPLDKVSSSVRKTSDELKSGTDKVVDNLFNNGNSCSGSGKAESIKNKLKSLGWTDNEINSINSIISEASGITRITSEDLSQITEDLKTDSEVDT
jgi:chromosome condensin MukBEF complex kleisin-like MukF subunit